MNPIGVFLVIVGLTFAVVGFRNHQDNLISAVAGRKVGKSTLS